jgi:ATP-dependent helicase HrpB
VPVHASLPMERLARAFEERRGQRRVFLATNVAETSVTLPGVTWVVDSGLVRMQLHRAGRVALALAPASQAAMDQRAGRAGRVAPGRCVRLWDRHWPAQASTPPEITRAELDDVLLQAACCGLDGEAFDRAPWVTQPPVFAVQRARARLERAGAMDGRGRITERGRALAALPASVAESRLMIEAPPELAATVADLIALMQRSGRLVLPVGAGEERLQEAREALFEGCRHEVAEALVALRRGDARRHNLHPSGLEEARKLSTALRAIIGIKTPPTKDDAPLPDDDALATYMARCLPEAAFAMRPRAARDAGKEEGGRGNKRKPWANGEVEVGVSPYIPHGEADREHVARHPATLGVLLQNAWIGDGKSVRGVGSLLLPCSPAALAAAGVGELEVGELALERVKGGWSVEAPVVQTLAGVRLAGERRALTGAALRAAVAELIRANRLFKGAAERLRDQLHLWGMLRDWLPEDGEPHWTPGALPEPPADEQAWLVSRLESLGLESCDELELISADDLMPELSASGLGVDELAALLTDFPRVWVYLGGAFRCEVQPRSRKVWIEPIDATAKKAKEPPREVLPRFRTFGIMYRQASRVVRLR